MVDAMTDDMQHWQVSVWGTRWFSRTHGKIERLHFDVQADCPVDAVKAIALLIPRGYDVSGEPFVHARNPRYVRPRQVDAGNRAQPNRRWSKKPAGAAVAA